MSDASLAPQSPENLLAEMERLLAALNADLVQFDADLQGALPSGDVEPILPSTSGSPAASPFEAAPLGNSGAAGQSAGPVRPAAERAAGPDGAGALASA